MKNIILLIVLISGFSFNTTAWAGNKLFVGGLPFATTSAEVNRLVEGFGTVLSVKVNSFDDNGTTSTKAEVVYASAESTDAAAAALDGMIYMGEPLTVAKKAREIVVVGSKVKEVIREAGLTSGVGLVETLSDKVLILLENAIRRATANGRSTVHPYDL